MPEEQYQDESRILSAHEIFKSDTFSILDVILNRNELKFLPNKGLLKDYHWLDYKTFSSIKLIKMYFLSVI